MLTTPIGRKYNRRMENLVSHFNELLAIVTLWAPMVLGALAAIVAPTSIVSFIVEKTASKKDDEWLAKTRSVLAVLSLYIGKFLAGVSKPKQ